MATPDSLKPVAPGTRILVTYPGALHRADGINVGSLMGVQGTTVTGDTTHTVPTGMWSPAVYRVQGYKINLQDGRECVLRRDMFIPLDDPELQQEKIEEIELCNVE